MHWLSSTITAGSAFRNPLVSVADGLFVDVGDRRAKLSQFWVLLVLSAAIAAGGVVGNSTPAVIGAMIIAPLATPIYGVALATVIGSPRRLRAAMALLLFGILANIGIGVLAGLLLVQRMPLDQNPQITGRTAPTMLDLCVAVATGIAGAFALTRRDVSNILAGVAIAISLVPVLAVVGITLGAGRLDLAWGALLLFLTNVAAILVAGTVVFGAAGYQRESVEMNRRAARRARTFIVIFLVALIVPLGTASLRTLRYDIWVQATSSVAHEWVTGSDWSVDSVRVNGDDIVITALGPGAPPDVETLEAEVRKNVPAHVTVILVEESGKTTEL